MLTFGSAYGIRTRVPCVRGMNPRPLDESAIGKALRLMSFAEAGGFEPPVQLPVRQFSKLLVSATHPNFQTGVINRVQPFCGANVRPFFVVHKFFRKKIHFYSKKTGRRNGNAPILCLFARLIVSLTYGFRYSRSGTEGAARKEMKTQSLFLLFRVATEEERSSIKRKTSFPFVFLSLNRIFNSLF